MDKVAAKFSQKGDGTFTSPASISGILGISIERNFGEEVSSCTIQILKNTAVKVGNEFRIYSRNNAIPTDANIIFRGIVNKINPDQITYSIQLDDWIVKLKDFVCGSLYDEEYTVSYVINDIVTRAGMIANVTDISSIGNITGFDTTYQTAFERLQYICGMYDTWFYYDAPTDRVVFKRKNSSTPITLEVGKTRSNNIVSVPVWGNDGSNIVTQAYVIGGAYTSTMTRNPMSTTSVTNGKKFRFIGNENFGIGTVTAKYTNAADAVIVPPNYTIEGDIIGDFYITLYGSNVSSCVVTLTRSMPQSNSGYTDSSKYPTYGKRTKVFDARSTNKENELLSYATNMVNNWSKEILNVSCMVNVGSSILGRGVTINDDINGKYYVYGSTWFGVVTSENYTWPSYGNTVRISDKSIKNTDAVSVLNRLMRDLTNALGGINTADRVATDGSTPMSSNLNLNSQPVYNLVVQNVTKLPG